MNRRAFFRSTALAVPSLSLWPKSIHAQPAVKIKAGFLGVAHSHAREKVRLVRQSPDFELVGIAAESENLRNQYASSGVRILDRKALLEASDVVLVESAVKDHARDALDALHAGKHVHVEKPPAANLKDLERMIDLARQKGLLLQAGYMWRYNPGFQAALEAARRGWLGDVFLVRASMNTLVGPEARREWAEFKGGAIFEQGCHLIDALVRLLGEPRKVTSFLRTDGDFGDSMADNTLAVFEFEKAMGIIFNTALQPNAGAHRYFEILGRNGTAMLKPLEPPALELDLQKAAGPYQAGRQKVSTSSYQRYAGELEALARAIRSGGKLAVSFEEEIRVQRAVLQASQMEL